MANPSENRFNINTHETWRLLFRCCCWVWLWRINPSGNLSICTDDSTIHRNDCVLAEIRYECFPSFIAQLLRVLNCMHNAHILNVLLNTIECEIFICLIRSPSTKYDVIFYWRDRNHAIQMAKRSTDNEMIPKIFTQTTINGQPPHISSEREASNDKFSNRQFSNFIFRTKSKRNFIFVLLILIFCSLRSFRFLLGGILYLGRFRLKFITLNGKSRIEYSSVHTHSHTATEHVRSPNDSYLYCTSTQPQWMIQRGHFNRNRIYI